MNNCIDVKVTVWNRLHFDQYANMKGIADLIQENGLDEVIDEKLGFVESETMYETEASLTPAKTTTNPPSKCMRMARKSGITKQLKQQRAVRRDCPFYVKKAAAQ